jgi:hypothetical protein
MREGLLLSDTTLARTGYRLLALLYAEYEWGDLRRDDDHDVLDEFAAESVDRISEDLVSLAAMARAADDELETLSALKGVFPAGVGTLQVGDTTKPLSPREACNKVLHARKFRYRLEFSELNPLYAKYYQRMGINRGGRFKSPVLVVEGEHHGSPWIAEIQAVPFVIATSAPGVHSWAFA